MKPKVNYVVLPIFLSAEVGSLRFNEVHPMLGAAGKALE
jgi:hypothetical protein